MNPLIVRLDAYLREHRPAVYATLQPGLSDAELDAWQATLGDLPLPATFKDFYRWRNGQPRNDDAKQSLVFHYYWLDCAEATDEWQGMKQMAQQNADEPYWWNERWLPFCFCMDDVLCLDGAGSFDGPVGQVIEVTQDGETILQNSSFDKWLECIVAGFETLKVPTDTNDINQNTGFYFFGEQDYKSLVSRLDPDYPRVIEINW